MKTYYKSLKTRIVFMKKEVMGSIAPYIAYLDKNDGKYVLNINFWDGKEGSSELMLKPLKIEFESVKLAEDYLLNFLNENKPMKKFVLFTGNSEIQ